jgi:hypothetical protein
MDTDIQKEEVKQANKPGPKPKPQVAAIDPVKYEADMAEIRAMFKVSAELMQGLQSQMALHNPVNIRKDAYSAEMPSQEQTLSAPKGEFKVLDEIGFETQSEVQNDGVEKFKEDLAMAEELLEISTPETQDPEHKCFVVKNNGKAQIFKVGAVQMVKRKFVEQLLRLRYNNWRSEVNKDTQADEFYLQKRTSSIRHPITILRDPNPKGKQWLENLKHQR